MFSSRREPQTAAYEEESTSELHNYLSTTAGLFQSQPPRRTLRESTVVNGGLAARPEVHEFL